MICLDMETSSAHNLSCSGDASSHENVFESNGECNIYMSIVWHCGHLGAAYYDVDTTQIHMLLDITESSPFSLLHGLINELKPVVIVASAKQDAGFLKTLQKWLSNDNRDDSYDSDLSSSRAQQLVIAQKFKLEMLSSIEFDYEASKRRLLSFDLPEIPDHFNDMERAFHMSSLIPLDCISTVRATGALVRYLEKKRIGVMLESPDTGTVIASFQTFTFKNTLHIDKSTYAALQVFQAVHHPSAYKMSTREGFSLFGLLNRTVTPHGQKLLKTWFYRPTLDRNVLNRRLDAISYFLSPKNEEVVSAIKNNLKKIKEVTRIVAKMKTSKPNVSDWFGVCQTAESALRIADICHSISLLPGTDQRPQVFEDIRKCFGKELAGIVSMISNCMEMSASKLENRFVVVPGISTVVDEMKATYAMLPTILGEVAQQELYKYGENFSACQIVYMRRIGYLLFTRKSDILLGNFDNLDIPGMTFVASTDETVFYKTPATEQLDVEFGDILENIAYHEMEIMCQLQNTLLQHASIFPKMMLHTAELDCLISLASAAKDFKYVRPQFVESLEVHVTGSRHPLQEHCVSLFVPNDIHFGPEYGMVKILTGPNASGKSVYLKQVGLVIFMAHIGCFVPAEHALIGTISSIFTVIRNPESLSSQLSTFANDLNRMSFVIRSINKNSLVLLDEFGKGTATLDGVSLLTSCLSYMVDQDATPMVLCATHFHCLAQQVPLKNSPVVTYEVMDTITSGSLDTVYLYQLVNGVSTQSYASSVAKNACVPQEIVSRAQEVCEMVRRNVPICKYNRSSSLSYQKACNDVASLVVKYDFTDSKLLREMLSSMQSMMGNRQTKSNSKQLSDEDNKH